MVALYSVLYSKLPLFDPLPECPTGGMPGGVSTFFFSMANNVVFPMIIPNSPPVCPRAYVCQAGLEDCHTLHVLMVTPNKKVNLIHKSLGSADSDYEIRMLCVSQCSNIHNFNSLHHHLHPSHMVWSSTCLHKQTRLDRRDSIMSFPSEIARSDSH